MIWFVLADPTSSYLVRILNFNIYIILFYFTLIFILLSLIHSFCIPLACTRAYAILVLCRLGPDVLAVWCTGPCDFGDSGDSGGRGRGAAGGFWQFPGDVRGSVRGVRGARGLYLRDGFFGVILTHASGRRLQGKPRFLAPPHFRGVPGGSGGGPGGGGSGRSGGVWGPGGILGCFRRVFCFGHFLIGNYSWDSGVSGLWSFWLYGLSYHR
jgi:hypothetical protein